MIVLLSPAKRMRQQYPDDDQAMRLPPFQDEALPIIKKLASLSKPKLKALMGTSDALVDTNQEHISAFHPSGIQPKSTQAIHAFNGEVYLGIESEDMSDEDLAFADQHIRILSGLYGYVRPLDVIQPYRLEMGSKLKVGRKADLYAYWQQPVTDALLDDLEQHDHKNFINLSSKEYIQAVESKRAGDLMINIHFKEVRDGKLRSIQTYMKRARGVMTRQVVQNRITDPEDIKGLEVLGYVYDDAHSSDKDWYFIKHPETA